MGKLNKKKKGIMNQEHETPEQDIYPFPEDDLYDTYFPEDHLNNIDELTTTDHIDNSIGNNSGFGWGYNTWKEFKDPREDKYFHKTPYYFAYGSNLNLEQMATRCPNARHIGNVKIKDWRLVFRGVADIEPFIGGRLVGGVFKINDTDELALDDYEGYASGLYTKDYFDFKIAGKEERVMYYTMGTTDIGQPSTYYYKTIWQGYEDCGLELRHLQDAYKSTLESITVSQKGCHYPKKWKEKKKPTAKKKGGKKWL
tara:strand:+ start:504 stop:1268 length:765 start_codon:yes stop_codon:yes gene_type:complete